MSRILCGPIVIVAMAAGGCGDAPPRANGHFPNGEICVSSNVSGAPFTIRNADLTIQLPGSTDDCVCLKTGEYEVEFGNLPTLRITPAIQRRLMLGDGDWLEVVGVYAP
jgi:hypothetical protein